jgi:hypothetical protein
MKQILTACWNLAACLLIQCSRKAGRPRSLMLSTLIRTFSDKESNPKIYKPFQKCVRRTLPNPTQPSPAQPNLLKWTGFHTAIQGATQQATTYRFPKPCATRNLSLSLSRQKTRAPKSSSQATPHKHNLAPPCMQVRRKGKERK